MFPMLAPVRVVVVNAKLVGEPKPGSVDFCHLVIVPVYPERVRVEGCVLYVIDWFEETVPPTASAVNVIVMVLITSAQPGLAVAVNVKYADPRVMSAAVGLYVALLRAKLVVLFPKLPVPFDEDQESAL